MSAVRLLEMLARLQVRGGASASQLAREFGVSERTIYRDVEALSVAGVPLYTEACRGGGIRIDPSYRVGGLPRLDVDEARGVLFAVVPSIAEQLGFDAAAADRTLMPAMEPATETAARVVHDRLLVEPTHWFIPPDDSPALAEIARAVWESIEVRLTYRGADVVMQPLGLILKGFTWYLLGTVRGGEQRLFKVSRVEAVTVLEHRFERPASFDLAAAWRERRQAFLESMPDYRVIVRVSPTVEHALGLLDEGAPPLPLPDHVVRDRNGWATVELRFERSAIGAARQLLQLGGDVEVLDPPELCALMARSAAGLADRYSD